MRHATRPQQPQEIEQTDQPYVVMATIHGPHGWYDVTRASTGRTVAVVARKADAHRIAKLLSEHEHCDLSSPAPGPDTVLAAVIEWAEADAGIDEVRTGDGWNRLPRAEALLREIAREAR